jgi:Ala-tRNA(Pro) deacylase
MFPDCEVGAMPPLGNLYDLKVYVDKSLAADEQIAFNAGTHAELIQIAYRDFERLVRPSVAHLTYDRSIAV